MVYGIGSLSQERQDLLIGLDFRSRKHLGSHGDTCGCSEISCYLETHQCDFLISLGFEPIRADERWIVRIIRANGDVPARKRCNASHGEGRVVVRVVDWHRSRGKH